MKRNLFILFFLLSLLTLQAAQWKTHLAYNNIQQITVAGDEVVVLSSGQIYSINKQTEQYTFYTRQDGMLGDKVSYIYYDSQRDELLLFYENGYVEIKTQHGILPISSLYITQTTLSKTAREAVRRGDILYLGMPYGVQAYNLATRAFTDAYFIGDEGAELPVKHLAIREDELYVATDSLIYHASIASSPVDFRHWTAMPAVAEQPLKGVAVAQGRLLALYGDVLYAWQSSSWQPALAAPIARLVTEDDCVMAIAKDGGFYHLNQSYTTRQLPDRQMDFLAYDPARHDYWHANIQGNLIHDDLTGPTQYQMNAPALNVPTRLTYAGAKLFVVPGDRWAVQSMRPGAIMMYEDGQWTNVLQPALYAQYLEAKGPDFLSSHYVYAVTDLMTVAADPADPQHYYVGAYGLGVFEMNGTQLMHHYDATTSAIYDASQVDPVQYTRVDCMQFDSHNNLWFVAGNYHITVKLADHSWDELLTLPMLSEKGVEMVIHTPANMCINERRHYVWLGTARDVPGLGLYDYAGTLTDKADDRAFYRYQFALDNGEPLTFDALRWIAEDQDDNIWLCTDNGLYYQSAQDDFFTSNRLHVLSGLTDEEWFLKDEKVTAMAIDALNRKWVGTQSKGVYLISADNQQILAHFSTENSYLISNHILSIAVNPVTGAVMFGTSDGLVEYDENESSALSDEELEHLENEEYSGTMHGWTYHYAYSSVSEVAESGTMVYGLAGGALFSLDTETEEIRMHNALSGLSGAGIGHILSDAQGRILVAYQDGNFDILYSDGTIRNLTDLKRKQLPGMSKLLNDACSHAGKMYMAMEFGVLVMDMRKAELSDWYQPTVSGNVPISKVAIYGDSIYAASTTHLYVASLCNNLSDYSFWTAYPLAARPDIALPSALQSEVKVGNCSYKADSDRGILRVCGGDETAFLPNGPECNSPYRMTAYGNRLYVVPGGRWATEYSILANIMRYEAGEWHNISFSNLLAQYPRLGIICDMTRVAVNPLDPNRYAISSYGYGLFMMNGDQVEQVYHEANSPLVSALNPSDKYYSYYVRVDGVAYDADGYLWMMNSANNKCMHVLSPDGQWASMAVNRNGSGMVVETPGDVLVDKVRPSYRWFVSARTPAGVGVLNTNGTPMNTSDDKTVFYSTFVDQSGKIITPGAINAIAQDRDGHIWVGTEAGVLMFPSNTDPFTSNRCRRIIIRRDDGSNLGDYMLGTERINGIAVDGGNRLWFATGSGAYLMDVDLTSEGNHQTVYHFTSANSPLPSDNVLSVAVMPETGEVFFGTDKGLVSFRSDATEPHDDYSSAYVFPNPVRPDYDGMLTVTGLMEHTSVKITDAAGRTIYSGMANGGALVWNLKDINGHRAKPGVYTIFCNPASSDTSGHKALKVLIM